MELDNGQAEGLCIRITCYLLLLHLSCGYQCSKHRFHTILMNLMFSVTVLVVEVYQQWAGKSAAFLNVLKDCLVRVEHDKMLKLAAVSSRVVELYIFYCNI